MLENIKYAVEFQSTGRELTGNYDFQKGLGAITGPNESGKTMIIEMIRYALYGTAALRGRVSTYSKLSVELQFQVKGVSYVVGRNGNHSNVKLYDGGEILCVGTTETNRKICDAIIGYDLSTFDTANVAQQGDLERLGTMKPTDRKRMVDKLVGLESIDELTKYASEQALLFGREVDALKSVLREPIEPVQPPDYLSSSILGTRVTEMESKKQRLDRLVGELSVQRVEPILPTSTIPLSSSELKSLSEEQAEIEYELRQLRKALPASPYTNDELKQFAVNFTQIKAIKEYNHVRESSYPTGQHTCPKCSHAWYDDPNVVDKFEQRLSAILDKVGLSSDTDLRELCIDLQSRTPVKENEIAQMMFNNISASDPKRIAELEGKVGTIDYKSFYVQQLKYEADLERYHKDKPVYDQWLRDRAARAIEVANLDGEVVSLHDLRRNHGSALQFERDRQAYADSKSDYDQAVRRVEAAKVKQQGWQSAKRSLVLLKTLVKQHLLPSLNKVASVLLTQMTAGQRQEIIVDDAFEVLVDGQDLETLSGSGKSVANLALRLALGQVLTNGIFSVFIGDEIDAYMDNERAENTSETLKNICETISQVIVISHKPVSDVDYQITLG